MPLLLVANLAPDPLMRPGPSGNLVLGLLMTATVGLFVGLFFSVLVGFPLLAVLARAHWERAWIPIFVGAVVGGGLGASGYFGANLFDWALVCSVNGALCGAVAYWCSRPNSGSQPTPASGRG
jgi:hypothetical protein